MEKPSTFKDLIAWQKAHLLVMETYKITPLFPKDEMYGLTSQLKRAIVSVPACIAEGFKRSDINDKIKFYNIAHVSLNEAYYYYLLASDLNFADTTELIKLYDEVSRLLNGLIKGAETRSRA